MEGDSVDLCGLVVEQGMWVLEPGDGAYGETLIIFDFWFHHKKIIRDSIIKL